MLAISHSRARWRNPGSSDAPRGAGTVGERFDGCAVVRGAASPEIAALVAQVNANGARLQRNMRGRQSVRRSGR